ncbi:ABC transporter substrate-binding protein [Agrococcus sp. 1P02AA]|uniref:ABC transporter substrate-binding protein n=1 Tax=Agrococcus sp. 1P02AA TaxID=3132259 RepID=UPI0039A63F9A
MQSFLSTKGRSPRRLAALGAATAGVLLLAACAGGGTPAPSESTDASETAPAEGGGETDSSFVIGTILPQTGNLEYLGPPEFAGVDLAVQELEEAGFEFDITLEHRDSGDTTTDIATQSADELIGLGADVIIGAASSGVSLTFIDRLIDAQVVQISPANTASDFIDYEDDGFYWRTAPNDALQGRVLANQILANGATSVGFITLNDPYGTGLEGYVTDTFVENGGEVTGSVLYNPGDSNFAGQVADLVSGNPDAIAILAFAETAQILPELITNGFPGTGMYFVDGNLSNSYTTLAPGALEGAYGTLPGNTTEGDFRDRLLAINPDLEDFSYAPESYDAVVLAALAAVQGGSADAITIRDNLQSVSAEGTKCTEIAECLELLANGEDIDYDGYSGPITFDENGDPSEAYIGIYQYGADNTYSLVTTEFGSLVE